MTATKQITLRLIRKNEFAYQLKSGARVLEKFTSVSGQWANTCQLFDTIDEAVRFYVNSAENLSDSLDRPIKINIIK